MWELIVAFLTDNAVLIGSGGAFLGIIEYVFAPFRGIRRRFKKPEKVEIVNPRLLTPVTHADTVPSEPVIKLTLADFEAKLDDREAEVRAKLKDAHADERAVLQSQLDELAKQKADPGKALEEAQARIRDLEARLAREGNEIGGKSWQRRARRWRQATILRRMIFSPK